MVKKENGSKSEILDLVIIGFGPAGYTASIYSSRYKIPHVIIGKQIGGQAGEAHLIENYPGFIKISGMELSMKFREHALSFGAKEVMDEVIKVSRKDGKFVTETRSGDTFLSKTVLVAIGTKKRKLNVPGEDKFYGKGVTYCATCDGPFYKGKIVGVVGGGDAANTSSLYLADIAKHVHQFVRRDVLRGEPVWHERVKENPKITLHFNTKISQIVGKDKLEKVILEDGRELKLDGLFIEIGSVPDTSILKDLGVDLDEGGYIKVNRDQSTNIPGLYAAGDVTDGSNKFRQITTAVGEAAVAANSIMEYLKR